MKNPLRCGQLYRVIGIFFQSRIFTVTRFKFFVLPENGRCCVILVEKNGEGGMFFCLSIKL